MYISTIVKPYIYTSEARCSWSEAMGGPPDSNTAMHSFKLFLVAKFLWKYQNTLTAALQTKCVDVKDIVRLVWVSASVIKFAISQFDRYWAKPGAIMTSWICLSRSKPISIC